MNLSYWGNCLVTVYEKVSFSPVTVYSNWCYNEYWSSHSLNRLIYTSYSIWSSCQYYITWSISPINDHNRNPFSYMRSHSLLFPIFIGGFSYWIKLVGQAITNAVIIQSRAQSYHFIFHFRGGFVYTIYILFRAIYGITPSPMSVEISQ